MQQTYEVMMSTSDLDEGKCLFLMLVPEVVSWRDTDYLRFYELRHITNLDWEEDEDV